LYEPDMVGAQLEVLAWALGIPGKRSFTWSCPRKGKGF